MLLPGWLVSYLRTVVPLCSPVFLSSMDRMWRALLPIGSHTTPSLMWMIMRMKKRSSRESSWDLEVNCSGNKWNDGKKWVGWASFLSWFWRKAQRSTAQVNTRNMCIGLAPLVPVLACLLIVTHRFLNPFFSRVSNRETWHDTWAYTLAERFGEIRQYGMQ